MTKALIGKVLVAATISVVPHLANGQAPVQPQALDFPPSAVKLLDEPFKQATDVDKAFLLRLEPDRLLAGFRREAGLTKKAEPYGGWEAMPAMGRYTMAGHSLGHYLSAISLVAASTGDDECRKRADYIVNELAECQKAAGSGMLYAGPQSREMFDEIGNGKIKTDHLFRLNDGYVPFYNIHKVMAGLRDAWLMLGNPTARDVLVRQADWLDSVFSKLSDAQVQEVLETEHGGIMEMAADVYAITGDAKHLALARKLDHQKLFEPLSHRQDVLNGMHANAQIPKVIGMERLYQLTGEKPFDAAAQYFWDNVVNTRTFANGGHGANEFFFAPNAFETTGINSPAGPETCNTYNMTKLSRQLWLNQPNAAIADYVERAIYNHLLASQDPASGGLVYFTSQRPGHYRTYSKDNDSFWCCVGTGMEAQARYGQFIYGHSGDHLWLDMLVPSELDWSDQKVKLRLDTQFPESDSAKLTLTAEEPKKLGLSIRCPGWLREGAMKLLVNGNEEKCDAKPGSYATIERTWKSGDTLEIKWPIAVRTEMLPGSKDWVALLWGPIVLAGEFGPGMLQDADFTRDYTATRQQADANPPIFRGTAADVVAKTTRVADKPLAFHTDGLALPRDVTLEPFYKVQHQRYALYWRLSPPSDEPNLALTASITCSAKQPTRTTPRAQPVNGRAARDGIEPRSSHDNSPLSHFDWWPDRNVTEWCEYAWDEPVTLSQTQAYWWDDSTTGGGCRTPVSWKAFYKNGDEWKPVETSDEFGVAKDQYNKVVFKEVKTTGLRLEIVVPTDASVGIQEWKAR
jgi:uncharacterized protein